MKKILAVFLLFILAMSVYAGSLIEAGKDDILYVCSVTEDKIGKGTFANLKSKGKTNGIIMKYSRDLSRCNTAVFGAEGDVVFCDVKRDRNGDFIVLGVADENSFGKGDLKGLKSFGGKDLIFVRYDKNLKVSDVQNFGSAGDDTADRLIVTGLGKIAVAGRSFMKKDNISKGFVCKLDEKFKSENVLEFRGSFKTSEDADITEFSSVCECANGTFIVLGHTQNADNLQKALVIQINDNFEIIRKKSFGTKDSIIRFTDIAEKPEGGFVAVGYSQENTQKGFIAELSMNLEKQYAFNYMPAYKGKNSKYNGLYSIEKFKNYDCYVVCGNAVFNTGGSINYYNIFVPGSPFSEIYPFPDFSSLSHLVCEDTSFYAVGIKENRVVPRQLVWFEEDIF